MWQEVMIKERIETALQEGLISQALARERRLEREKHSLLCKLQRLIQRLREEKSRNDQRPVVLVKHQN